MSAVIGHAALAGVAAGQTEQTFFEWWSQLQAGQEKWRLEQRYPALLSDWGRA
jgi:hypothetical protein